jgi:hypothetical protein
LVCIYQVAVAFSSETEDGGLNPASVLEQFLVFNDFMSVSLQ